MSRWKSPRGAKGSSSGSVVRIVTPGSVTDEEALDPKDNLHMAALTGGEGSFGLAYVDLSTGDFRVTEVAQWEQVLYELGRINPAELLLLDQEDLWKQKALGRFRQERLSSVTYDPSQSGGNPERPARRPVLGRIRMRGDDKRVFSRGGAGPLPEGDAEGESASTSKTWPSIV